MYELVFDDKAIDFLNKLPKDLRERVYNKIIKTKENPLRYFKRLAERTDYKLRIGDYRVIADINVSSKRIEITVIGHRKNVYDKS